MADALLSTPLPHFHRPTSRPETVQPPSYALTLHIPNPSTQTLQPSSTPYLWEKQLTCSQQLTRLTAMDSRASSISQPAPRTRAHSTAVQPTRRDPALDGLRGLAILMVFVYHYGGGLKSSDSLVHLLGLFTESCWTGVILFFALSGFLITGSLWESIGQKHRLRNFYVRRALRILPLYFTALLATAVFAIARGSTFAELKPLATFALFLQDMPHIGSRALEWASPLPLYHLWTIAVEEQFYLIWPLVLLFAHSRRHALRLSLWFVGLTELFLFVVFNYSAFRPAVVAHIYDKFLFTNTSALALGAAVALAMGSRVSPLGRKPGSPRFVRKSATWAFLIGLALFLYSSLTSGSLYLMGPLQFWFGMPAISVAAAAAIPIVMRDGLPRRIFSIPALGWLGRISYGFYILHILLEPLFDHLGAAMVHTHSGQDYQIARLLCAFPITVALSWLSFHLFEMPILSLKRYFPMRQELPWGEPIEPALHTHTRRRRTRSKSGSAPDSDPNA
jgi:peptidoglycan/LPS O-acetylase OafA/YrhL